MCQISKNLSQLPGERPRIIESGINTLTIQRQESVVMENLRQIEEREALEKWERIVRYCKEVYRLIKIIIPYKRGQFFFQLKRNTIH